MYRGQAFSANTKKTYHSHLRSYLSFCEMLQIVPVPISEINVAKYAAYLARRLKPSSVRQYLNIIRVLHLECKFPNPCSDSWYIKTTLKGIEKCKGTDVQRKTPITPELLLQIKRKLDLSKTNDSVFWAACIVMFFGLLRKSNLFGTDAEGFNKDKHLTTESFSVSTDLSSITIEVKWAKNNQSKDHTQRITLHRLPNHPLCPVTAVLHLFRMTGPGAPESPVFPITGQSFNRKLRSVSGTFLSGISSHSFRRGGATWALSCGIPGEIVKVMGDWQSPCYLLYLDQIPRFVIDTFRRQFGENLPQSQ